MKRYLNTAGRDGLNPYEINHLQTRIARLEQRVQHVPSASYGAYGNYGGYGYDNRIDGPLGDGIDDENN